MISGKQKRKESRNKTTPSYPVAQLPSYSPKTLLFFVAGIIVITLVVFSQCLYFEFIFWDDPEYTTKNPFILDVSLKKIFSEFYFGNYHPLTLLTYALEYKFFGFDAKVFHTTNLILHLANTVFVFLFVLELLKTSFLLTREKNGKHKIVNQKNLSIAAIVSMVFGIHPMRVESVAWVSELKDVQYSFFFLLGLIFYLRYIQNNFKFINIALSLIFFLLSLFSKAQAVVLPLVFLAIDYYIHRGINKRMLIEKIPFFGLSLLFGILAIKAQIQESAINPDYYNNADSIFWGCHGLMLYVYKSVLPIHLSGVHPYPLNADRGMPSYVYLSLLFVLGVALLVYLSTKRTRDVMFGMLFFLASIIMVLKFIPVGDAMISERYTYIAYIGIFFIVATGFFHLSEMISLLKNKFIQYTLATLLIAVCGFVSFERCKVWANTMTFWTDVSEKYPGYWRAHNNIGHGYYEKGQYDKAVESYTRAIQSDKWCPPVPYLWRGVVYLEHLKQPELAIADFKKVLDFPNKADQTQIDGRLNLGLAYFRTGKYKDAVEMYNEVLQKGPSNAKAWFLMALANAAMGEHEMADNNYTQAIRLNPQYLDAWLNRGALYTDKMNKYDEAIADFKMVLQLQPNHPDASTNIALALYKKGDNESAINMYSQILQNYPDNSRVYYLRALAFAAIKEFKKAMDDMEQAKKMGVQVDENLVKMWKSQSQAASPNLRETNFQREK